MTEPTPVPQPTPRPEPVMTAAKQAGWIAGLIGTLATALGAYGAISGQHWAVDAAAIVVAISTGLAGVMPTITAGGARAQVTPLASPQAVDGAPLVPVEKVSGGSLPYDLITADTSPNMGPDAP